MPPGGAGGGSTVMPPGGAGGGSTVTPPGGAGGGGGGGGGGVHCDDAAREGRGRVQSEDGQREQPSRWQRLESNVPVALTVARGSNESAHGGLSPMVCAVVR